MFRKLLSIALAALLLLTASVPAMGEFAAVEQIAPDEPIVTDGEYFHVTAVYDSQTDRSRYAISVKDGAPVTAQDVLFTLYVYLDPGCSAETTLSALAIDGLRSYRLQMTPPQIAEALCIMNAIAEAGPDHVPSVSDGWTEEMQNTYWQLANARAEAGDMEFPVLAQQIIDFCANRLSASSRNALGFTASEILADDGLKAAYALSQWGFARCKDGILTANHSGSAWNLAGGKTPSADDFAAELRLAYDNDFAACWSMECPDPSVYAPALPDIEEPFLRTCFGGASGPVTSVSGIVLIDGRTLEISLEGIDLRSDRALLGIPILTLSACGDETLWKPEDGLYGHPFGDVSAIDLSSGVLLCEPENAGSFRAEIN